MLSLGMFAALAVSIASRNRGLNAGSPPPARAATVISRISFVNIEPRFASLAAFLRLICAHLLWPAKGNTSPNRRSHNPTRHSARGTKGPCQYRKYTRPGPLHQSGIPAETPAGG